MIHTFLQTRFNVFYARISSYRVTHSNMFKYTPCLILSMEEKKEWWEISPDIAEKAVKAHGIELIRNSHLSQKSVKAHSIELPKDNDMEDKSIHGDND